MKIEKKEQLLFSGILRLFSIFFRFYLSILLGMMFFFSSKLKLFMSFRYATVCISVLVLTSLMKVNIFSIGIKKIWNRNSRTIFFFWLFHLELNDYFIIRNSWCFFFPLATFLSHFVISLHFVLSHCTDWIGMFWLQERFQCKEMFECNCKKLEWFRSQKLCFQLKRNRAKNCGVVLTMRLTVVAIIWRSF